MRSNQLYILLTFILSSCLIGLFVWPHTVKPENSRAAIGLQKNELEFSRISFSERQKTRMDPASLALSFHYVERKILPHLIPTVADWLKPLGTITDDEGIARLYFKNTRDGTLIRIRTDRKEENGQSLIEITSEKFHLAINGEECYVNRSGK